MADEQAPGAAAGTPPESAPPQDAAYWKAEAKKAFDARDEERQRRRELESRALSKDEIEEYQKLRQTYAQQEEQRRREAGDFDAWRKQIVEQHEAALAAERKKLSETKARAHDLLVTNAFNGAADWFGPDGRTVLTPDIAAAYYGRFVEVQEEDGQPPRVVVRDPATGQILANANGPLPFAEAIGKVVEATPNKDRVLRGSGKPGTSTPGGRTTSAAPPDLDALLERAKSGDKAAIDLLRERQKKLGGMVMGRAFQ